MDESSVDDLNKAFINEPSLITPQMELIDIKAQLDDLHVHHPQHFSITAMLQKHCSYVGGKTQTVSKNDVRAAHDEETD